MRKKGKIYLFFSKTEFNTPVLRDFCYYLLLKTMEWQWIKNQVKFSALEPDFETLLKGKKYFYYWNKYPEDFSQKSAFPLFI